MGEYIRRSLLASEIYWNTHTHTHCARLFFSASVYPLAACAAVGAAAYLHNEPTSLFFSLSLPFSFRPQGIAMPEDENAFPLFSFFWAVNWPCYTIGLDISTNSLRDPHSNVCAIAQIKRGDKAVIILRFHLHDWMERKGGGKQILWRIKSRAEIFHRYVLLHHGGNLSSGDWRRWDSNWWWGALDHDLTRSTH